MDRYKLYIEDTRSFTSPIGCGNRICIVLSEARLWTALFYPPTLTRFRMVNAEFARSIKENLGPVGDVTLGILARAEELYTREGLQFSRRALQQIRNAA